jgi:hypothetical protein
VLPDLEEQGPGRLAVAATTEFDAVADSLHHGIRFGHTR